MEREALVHPFPPCIDERSRVLFLGSFPSPKSRENGFFYGHPQNRFWKVMAALFDAPLPQSNEEKAAFAKLHRIALWDVLASCEITGAADSSIKNPVPNPIGELVQTHDLRLVCTTGNKASALYDRFFGEIELPHWCLPSTSPANAGCSLSQLMETYREILPFLEETP